LASIICVFAATSPRSTRFREAHLLVGRQQRHLGYLAQVEPQRVERRLDGQVELRRLLLLRLRLFVRRMLVLFSLDEVDAVVDQVRVEVLDLILGEFDILEPCRDLVVVEEPLLETVLNELLQLLNVRKRDLESEHRPR
jgi:hypothetical protein